MREPYFVVQLVSNVLAAQVDKYITNGEFLRGKVYGCKVVITNVSRMSQQLDVLLQIPQGAMPVSNGFVMRSKQLSLGSYTTQSLEYSFYFPDFGTFGHYPAHVASQEELVAFAAPSQVKVVQRPSDVDTTSWQYVSQQGTLAVRTSAAPSACCLTCVLLRRSSRMLRSTCRKALSLAWI